jgi:hypothetical protein
MDAPEGLNAQVRQKRLGQSAPHVDEKHGKTKRDDQMKIHRQRDPRLLRAAGFS